MTNRRFNLIILIALTSCLNLVFSGTSTEQPTALKVACVGDSITFGSGIKNRKINSYPAQLQILLGADTLIGNFGKSGATLLKKGDKPYVEQLEYKAALEFKPNIVIIKLGTNDSKPHNWEHQPKYVSDYVELINSFQNLKSKPTVWICYPVPVYPERWGITDKVVKEDIIPLIDEVAKQANVQIIDLYSALSGKKEMFPDAVHPNANGAKVIAETIASKIKTFE